MNQKDYIEKIKEAEDSYYVRSTVEIYINKEYNLYYLMNLNISDDKKMALYETIIKNKFDISLYNYINDEKDKVLFLKAFCYVNPDVCFNYYKMLNDISDPVSSLTVSELNILTRYMKVFGWHDLEETIGFEKTASIINKIISFNDIYLSCHVIKYAYEDNKKIIYESACNNINYFKLSYEEFDDKYKEELLDFYFDNNKNDYEISKYIVENKLIKDDINLIENSSSTVIYSYIMSNDLSKEDEKRLEKALLKTNDFEYITYYYFYKNKYMFYKLFGSLVLFLAFLKLNEKKFKNKIVLNDVLEKINDEMTWFNKYMEDKSNYVRIKRINKD